MRLLLIVLGMLALAGLLPGQARAEDYPNAWDLREAEEWPALMTFRDGRAVETPADWEARRQEILDLYRHYIYGSLPDGTEENVTYTIEESAAAGEKKLTVHVARGEKEASFDVLVTLPAGEVPPGGAPCYLEYTYVWFGAAQASPNCVAAAKRGYAGISYDPLRVASDNALHQGAFYRLYPYDLRNGSYPGVLAAWAWGVSRVADALEAGAGAELGIDPAALIAAGVSRYGKSVLVAGAYDPRIRVTVPACSGAGGAALFRTDNHGKTYDLTSLGGPAEWTNESINEPLSNLQGGEGYWFCRNFCAIPSAAAMPVEQYMLCALTAGEGRHLILVTGITSEGWNNTEGQYQAFALSQPVWDLLGLGEQNRMIVHLDGHALLPSDLEKILDYCDAALRGTNGGVLPGGMKGEFFRDPAGTVAP